MFTSAVFEKVKGRTRVICCRGRQPSGARRLVRRSPILTCARVERLSPTDAQAWGNFLVFSAPRSPSNTPYLVADPLEPPRTDRGPILSSCRDVAAAADLRSARTPAYPPRTGTPLPASFELHSSQIPAHDSVLPFALYEPPRSATNYRDGRGVREGRAATLHDATRFHECSPLMSTQVRCWTTGETWKECLRPT
mgnify:CR=1 FL=1